MHSRSYATLVSRNRYALAAQQVLCVYPSATSRFARSVASQVGWLIRLAGAFAPNATPNLVSEWTEHAQPLFYGPHPVETTLNFVDMALETIPNSGKTRPDLVKHGRSQVATPRQTSPNLQNKSPEQAGAIHIRKEATSGLVHRYAPYMDHN